MAMRVRKPARGVNGDCNRHRLHQRYLGVTKPIPINRAVLPYAALRGSTLQSLLKSSEANLMAAHPTNVAFAIKPAEDIPVEAEQVKAPPVKLATDHGHDVRDDEEKLQMWLKEFSWTPKSRKNSVVYLIHPGDKRELVPIVDGYTPMVMGNPLTGVTCKRFRYQWTPISWSKVKERTIKRSANSRRERVNNVQYTHGSPSTEDPSIVNRPPWPAANDSAHQGASTESPSEPLRGEHNFMEQVALLRVARQLRLRQEHAEKQGFMVDVAGIRTGAKQYNRRRAIFKRRKLKAKRQYKELKADYWLGKNQYTQRAFLRQFLEQHGEPIVTVIRDITEDQADALISFADLYYPRYMNRDFWNKEPEDTVDPDLDRTITTEEIIRRAEMKIRDEAHRQASYYRSWLRGHANRKESPFDTYYRMHVVTKVHTRSHKHRVFEVRQQAARRVAAKRVTSHDQTGVFNPSSGKENSWVEAIYLTHSPEVYSKLIHADQVQQKLITTHDSAMNKVVEYLNLVFSKEHGMILPSSLYGGTKQHYASPAVP